MVSCWEAACNANELAVKTATRDNIEKVFIIQLIHLNWSNSSAFRVETFGSSQLIQGKGIGLGPLLSTKFPPFPNFFPF